MQLAAHFGIEPVAANEKPSRRCNIQIQADDRPGWRGRSRRRRRGTAPSDVEHRDLRWQAIRNVDLPAPDIDIARQGQVLLQLTGELDVRVGGSVEHIVRYWLRVA